MSDSIKDAFKKREETKSEGFSLLAAFGRKDESDEDMGNKVNISNDQPPGAQWLSGRVLDSRPRRRGSSLTSVTVLWSLSKTYSS